MIAPDSFNYCLGPGPQFIICWTITLLPLIELCAAATAHHKEQVFVPPLGTYLINPPFHTEGNETDISRLKRERVNTAAQNGLVEERMVETFDEFKKKYGKTYKREYREIRSKQAFEANKQVVLDQEHSFQEGKSNFRCTTNALSDLGQAEFKMRYLRMTNNEINSDSEEDPIVASVLDFGQRDFPKTVDWRDEGFRTPPDNQKSCGSCYAFSIARSIEAQIFRRTGKLMDLSEQQLVDCSTRQGNHGCAGGSLRNTLRYVEKSGGLMRAVDYPYVSKQTRCRFVRQMALVNITSWNIIKSEEALQAAVATIGPIAVSLNAAPKTFQLYGKGIYDDVNCSSVKVNHAMLVVGYTADFWILKNWWGQKWGEDGYMRLKRGSNLCGVSNFAAYAII